MSESLPRTGILVASSDEWRSEIDEFLRHKGLTVITASSYESASGIVRSRSLRGTIVVSDWLITSDGNLTDLANTVSPTLPLLMLVRESTNYDWFDKIFSPPVRDYHTMPVDLDALDLFIQKHWHT